MWFRRKRVKQGASAARAEREAAEQRLEHAREHVILPLREMRARNHIQDDISRLIRQKARKEAEGT